MSSVSVVMAVYPQQMPVTTWSSGICDCCEDIQICCFGFWCPCCLLCQISSDFGECFCLGLLDMFSGCIPSTSLALRSTMRERFRIQGSMCSDCAVVTFCTLCSWCQMAREMKVRRRPRIDMHAAQPMAYTTTPPTGLYPPAP
uniref:Uncharacterized protein n=1 Tax=Esox lucius TaxID=8010 RepID=A0A3P8Z4E7_ESOLU